MWNNWDGKTDLKKRVLVKTENGDIVIAQQLGKSVPDIWVIYVPGLSMFFQPQLESKVLEYIELETLEYILVHTTGNYD